METIGPPVMASIGSTSSFASTTETSVASTRTALIIDGSYAMIGARSLGGKIDYVKLRTALEEQASTQFGDCWFFDQSPSTQRFNPSLRLEYNKLKFAPPDGPQFQVSLFPMKKYSCHCRRCGSHFTQNVQKGVDNGIATKILSLAYENICDRFVLFAGDGDFYSSLSHVRNVLRKDIWVMGYRGTVSGDLQQLASRVIWMNDLWSQVKSVQQINNHEQGWEEGRKHEGYKDEARQLDDHRGKGFQHRDDSSSSVDEIQDVGRGRQVVIAPRFNQATRRRVRGNDGRSNGRGRSRNGRRSQSRDRSRSEQPSSKVATATNAMSDVDTITTSFQEGTTIYKKKPRIEEKRGFGGKKRKRNGIGKSEQRRSKRGEHGEKQADDLSVFALSDISSDENSGKPFLSSLPVPLGSATSASVMTAQVQDFGMDDVIDLASDTGSE
ncbi:unnamed protein product [Peronospora belbahrii]|uniref:NYN domain-containing protein n=1 Tax=Peronospora belbahrii TaxID=622444 RepID=A0AAU9KY88_9STRA|nr:unnamed protein product [Peronospora belbahrii]CAH0517938.1 unnamed protein product [Peronospora belbahrii]